jgi:hypothetical protein
MDNEAFLMDFSVERSHLVLRPEISHSTQRSKQEDEDLQDKSE